MSKHVTLRLTIEVSYALNGVDQKELESMLADNANHMAGEGLFTGGTAAEVTSWKHSIDGIHASAP